MRIRFFIAFLVWAALTAASAAQAEMMFNGSVSNQARLRILQGDAPEEKDYGWDFMMLMSQVDLIGRATNDDSTGRLFMNIDLRHDPVGVFETNDMEIRLREAYGGFYSQYFSLEAGYKKYNWGKADEFNPTDLINPEDLRWFMTFDKPARKQGVFSANATVSYDAFSLQTVVVPVFTPTILPAPGTDWVPWELKVMYDIAEGYEEFVEFKRDLRPEPTLEHSEIATRAFGHLGRLDFEGVFFYGYDPLPTYNIILNMDPVLYLMGQQPLAINEEYQRMTAYGGSLAFTVGKLAFRGEGAYYAPKYFMHDVDESMLEIVYPIPYEEMVPALKDKVWRTRHASWSAAGGVDARSGTELYVNLQYVHTQILDYNNDQLDEENEGMITGKCQTRWLDEDLEISLDGVYNVWHYDWYAKPYVRYKLTSDFSGELGVQAFGGKDRTRFGDFKYNSFMYSNFKYTF